MSLSQLFVTGTDTDVGKTAVTACLAAARGGSIAVKPVASGVLSGAGEDATQLGRAAGHPPMGFATYTAAVSPHRAAALEGAELDVAGMLRWLNGLRGDPLLIEGVGGWRVPLSTDPPFDVTDLARAVGAPVLIVAADRLGVLNHTLLTRESIAARGLLVAGVVLNQGIGSDASTPHNLYDLQALISEPVVAMPQVDLTDLTAMADCGHILWERLSC